MTGSDQGEPTSRKPLYVRILTLAVAVFMCAIMVFMFADVVGRYALNSSIRGGFEIVGLMLGLLVFSSLPLITRSEDHITVGLLDAMVKGKAKRVRDIFVLIATALIVGFISFRMWRQGDTMREDEQIGEYLDIQIAPFAYIMAGLSFVAFLILLGLIIKFFRTAPDEAAK